ncbi:hypothetical protein BS47DRAFT_1341772 [Hydnum rufescens UP504]|uniref:Uncharacterized protein n=1 Tax=Hydnum rufescens UP504 TaxID=1448309 RepID=A0A9P6B265_9AGAM|nr:hypothetical protein BS47DRAFT_1341772 [Hydnum rufescens UP504]
MGFSNQPDAVFFFICFRVALLIAEWTTQIEEDPSLRDNFHPLIEEFSSIPLHHSLETLTPDLRESYTTTMTVVYSSSVTLEGVYRHPGLRTEFVGRQVIAWIPQCISYLERGNHSNESDLKGFLLLISFLLRFQAELQELIRMDALSVLVRIFHRHHDLTSQIRDNFEVVLLQFCSHNPTSREYFLKSDALLYVRDRLMRKPQSSFLLTALYVMDKSECVSEFHDRLISCGVLVPLARCLALTNFHDKSMYNVTSIFSSIVEHNKGEHLLERPILSYLTQLFNHPYVVALNCLWYLTLALNILRFSRLSFVICGIIFFRLCALGDDAKKEVVNAGALPGLCRLAHPGSHDTDELFSSEGSEHWHVPFEDLLVAIAGIDASCAAKVAEVRKHYYRSFKVQTLNAPRPTIWGEAQAMMTRSKA